MEVDNLIMHLPWEHAEDINSKTKNNISDINLENKLGKNPREQKIDDIIIKNVSGASSPERLFYLFQ